MSRRRIALVLLAAAIPAPALAQGIGVGVGPGWSAYGEISSPLAVGASLEVPVPGTDPGEAIHDFVRLRIDYRRLGDRHPHERRVCVDFLEPCYTVEEASEVTISYWALGALLRFPIGDYVLASGAAATFVTVERAPSGGASRGHRGPTVFGELRAPGYGPVSVTVGLRALIPSSTWYAARGAFILHRTIWGLELGLFYEL